MTSCIEACCWARQTEKARIRGRAESEAMRGRKDKRAEMGPSCSLNRSAARAGAGGRPFNKGGTKYPSWIDRQCPSFLAHNFRKRKEGTQAERRRRACAFSSTSRARHFSRKAQILCPNETENEAEMEPACAKASDQIRLNAGACKCEVSQAHRRVLSALGKDPSSPLQEEERGSSFHFGEHT